jgi:hypothetical protein
MRSHRRLLLIAAALVAAAALPLTALARSLGTSTVKLKLSGAQHGTYNNTGLDRCQIEGISVMLYAGKYTSTTDGYAGYAYPYLDISRIKRHAPTRNVNLAKTKDYLVALTTSDGGSRVAGHVGRLSRSINVGNLGSGRLTFSHNGFSGSVSAVAAPEPTTGTHGKVRLKASWHCSSRAG